MSTLKKLWLPASLNVFKDGEDVCEMEGIYVDSANQSYKDVDGVLYNKNMTTLVKYPSKKTASTFTVPNGVTKLEDCSMDSNTSLQKVVDVYKRQYMYWQKRFDRKNPDQEIEEKMLEIRKEHKDYGYRRILGELRNQGYSINKKKVQRIVQKLGLQVMSYTCLLYTSRCV